MYPTPYYAVIFTSTLKNDDGYHKMAAAMEELAHAQDGFLGMDSARSEQGITVSYWKDKAAILSWKNNAEHQVAMQLGKSNWYHHYNVKICKVEREYAF